MEKKRKIMVFDNDESFLFMLKGYCYANNVQMTKADFNIEGIKKLEQLNPVLIFIPLDWISASPNMNIETSILRLSFEKKNIKICGLNKQSTEMTPAEVPAWIHGIINNPLDIVEIDRFLKNFFFSNGGLPERRTSKERRTNPDRRHDNISNVEYAVNKETALNKTNHLHHDNRSSEQTGFCVDSRNKCLIIKGNKIDLTPKEFELIEYLSTDLDRIFTPDEIIKHLWPENQRATKADLYQYIHLLRKKVENDHNSPKLILNVKGFGYKLNILSHSGYDGSFIQLSM